MSNSKSHSIYSVIRITLSYIAIFVAIIWFNQQAINTYYEQKYHRASPLELLNSFEWWQSGARFKQQLLSLRPTSSPDVKITPVDSLVPEAPEAPLETEVAVITPKEAPATVAEPAEQKPILFTLNPDQKVFFIGDSLMQGVAPHVMSYLKKNHQVLSIDLSKRSTGLLYTRAYNWPKVVAETLASETDIGLLVVMLGPNDPWNMAPTSGYTPIVFGSDEWKSKYTERIESILTLAESHNIPVIWVGAPAMEKENLDQGMRVLNQLYQHSTEKFHGIFLDANEIFGYQDLIFDKYYRQADPPLKIRDNDGIHFTPRGQRMIAQHIIDRIQVITPAPAEPEPSKVAEGNEQAPSY